MFDIESDCLQSRNGNYVLLDDSAIKATVFQNPYEVWQIIINGDGVGKLVVDEFFMDPHAAIKRVNEIFSGADCVFKTLRDRY